MAIKHYIELSHVIYKIKKEKKKSLVGTWLANVFIVWTLDPQTLVDSAEMMAVHTCR